MGGRLARSRVPAAGCVAEYLASPVEHSGQEACDHPTLGRPLALHVPWKGRGVRLGGDLTFGSCP